MERKRLYIAAGILGGIMLLFIILGFLFSPKTGSLVINAPINTPVNVTITNSDLSYNKTYVLDAAAKQEVNLKPGSYQVLSSAGSLKSIDILAIKENVSSKLDVSFAASSSAAKIAAGVDNCPYVVGESVYDYDCLSSDFIFQMNGPQDPTKAILFDSELFDYLVAYKTGFLGFPSGQKLHYMDLPTGTMQPVFLPGDIDTEDTDAALFVTTSHNPADTFFALSLASSDSVYIYKDVGDASPIKLKLPKEDSLSKEGFMSSLTFKDDHLVLYTGPIADDAEHEGTLAVKEVKETPEGLITEYDLQGNIVKSITTPKDFEADQVIKLTDKYYAADRIEGVEFFYLEGKKLKSIHTVDEVVSVVPVGEKLYVHVNNAVNVFTPGNSGGFSIKSTYTPLDETLSGIYAGPGYLIFTAKTRDSLVSNAYRLTQN